MTEQLSLARSHLEEAEVLAVLRAHAVTRTRSVRRAAPPRSTTRRRDRSPSAASARATRGSAAAPRAPRAARASRGREPSSRGRGQRVTCGTESQRGLLREARIGEEPAMLSKNRITEVDLSIVATWRASSEPRSALVPAWAAAGVRTRTRAHRPVTRAFREQPPRRRQGTARAAVGLNAESPARPLCQIRRGYRRAQTLPRSLTKPSQGLLQAFSRRTTRNAPRGAFRRLRDRDSNPNFRSQNPASYH